MSSIKLSNIPTVSVGKFVNDLSNAYCSLIKNGLPLKLLPSVMLWGPPGIGKSQAIRELADEIKAETGKKTVVTDVRLLLFNPIDLRGIPTANNDKTLAIWLKPQIFNMDASDDVVNILFLDEISAAPQSVQAAAYQITLDRVVGEHKLPDNCIVIAAGNRTTDKSVAYKMPKALANRLLHLEISSNFESWRAWAIKKGINEKVIGFLSFRQDYLMKFDPANEDLAFATPRSWEMVSNILNYVDSDISKVHQLISGVIGIGITNELNAWDKIYARLPGIEDIFNGKMPSPPSSADALYALTSAMTAYAREHKDDIVRIGHSIKYACQLPADFSTIVLKDYMYIEPNYKHKLMMIPEFKQWMSTKGKLLNGIV